MSMSRMQTRPTSEQSPQALNRSRDLLTCLTATDERRFEIRGGTSGRSRPTAGADVRSRAGLQQVARMSHKRVYARLVALEDGRERPLGPSKTGVNALRDALWRNPGFPLECSCGSGRC